MTDKLKAIMIELSDKIEKPDRQGYTSGRCLDYRAGFTAAVEIMEAREKRIVKAITHAYEDRLEADREHGRYLIRQRALLLELGIKV